MRHADHDLFDAALSALLNQIVEHRDQRLAAFQREALLRRVFRREIELEAFGGRQVAQQRLALFGREAVLHASFLEAVLQPQPLVSSPRRARTPRRSSAVDVTQLRDDVAQLHALRNRVGAAACIELGVEIRRAEAEVFELEDLGNGTAHEAERIDVGEQMAAIRVHLDEPGHRALLRRRVARLRPASSRARRPAGSCARCASASRSGPCAVSPRQPPVSAAEILTPFRARPSRDRRGIVRRGIRCKGRCLPPEAWSRAKLAKSRSLRSQVPVRAKEE